NIENSTISVVGSCSVDQNVNRAKAGNGRSGSISCLSLTTYITAHRERLGTASGGGLLGRGEIGIDTRDLCTRPSKPKTDGSADATASSSNDRCFATQIRFAHWVALLSAGARPR